MLGEPFDPNAIRKVLSRCQVCKGRGAVERYSPSETGRYRQYGAPLSAGDANSRTISIVTEICGNCAGTGLAEPSAGDRVPIYQVASAGWPRAYCKVGTIPFPGPKLISNSVYPAIRPGDFWAGVFYDHTAWFASYSLGPGDFEMLEGFEPAA